MRTRGRRRVAGRRLAGPGQGGLVDASHLILNIIDNPPGETSVALMETIGPHGLTNGQIIVVTGTGIVGYDEVAFPVTVVNPTSVTLGDGSYAGSPASTGR